MIMILKLTVSFFYRVIETKNSKYPVGTLVVGYLGWRNKTVVNPNTPPTMMKNIVHPLPKLRGLSPSLGLGALGMPGYIYEINR